jgi:uncharacterized protein (TIGR03118 family)
VAGKAALTDPNLVKAWGITRPLIGAWMVANNGSGTSTTYDADGNPYPPASGTVVAIPPAGSSPVGSLGTPTGVVSNPTGAFVIASDGIAAPADAIFATADGTLAAWSELVSPDTALTVVDNAGAEALYTGIAIGSNPTGGAFLYAADFRSGTVDVFDEQFDPVTIEGGFVDSRLPPSYAPYGIQNIAGDIYVSYAKQNRQQNDTVPGLGNGFVSVFDTEGNFVRRFTSQGQLNAPWGMAQAPASFGRFGGATIIGNAGDGHINAFDPVSGRFLGQLQRSSGGPITVRGLFGIGFGNGGIAGSVDTLYFAAGPSGGAEGLFGSIAPGQ